MNFAENLRDSINTNSETTRLTNLFRSDPEGSFETTLDYRTAKELGFVVSGGQFGTYVSLPEKHYGR